VFVATLVLDQLSKVWALRTLRGAPVQRYAGDLFRLEYAENAGSFLSLGDRLPAAVRVAVFVVAVGAVLVALVIYGVVKPTLDQSTRIALLAIAAGGLSNWVDRVIRAGRVVDFMNLGLGSLRTGIFNVADLAIVFGGVWLFVHGLGEGRKAAAKTGP
jgi:signal peptidase II